MLLVTIKRRFTLAILSILLSIMLLPLNMLPGTVFAQGSTVSISPSQGTAGTQVTGTGSSWTAGDAMLVQWDDGTNLANTTVQSDGTFTVSFTIPTNVGQGGHTVYFTDQTARYFIPTTFTVSTGTVDLQTLSIVALQAPSVGTSTTFRASIRNNGTQASGNFNIQWIADGTNLYGGHYSIPAGAVDTHDHIWSNLTSGQHTLTFIANYDHTVSETNYNNNQVTITFTVTTKAATFLFPWDATKQLAFAGGPHIWTGSTRSGLDFSDGNKKTHILAMASGVVTFVGNEVCKYGPCKTVKVHNDSGYDIWYVHLSSFAPGIAPNVPVSQGTWLGNEGDTGANKLVHIHIELRLQGTPAPWDGMTIDGWQIHKDCSGYSQANNQKQNYAPCYPTNYNGYINNGNVQAVPLESGPQFSVGSTNHEH